MNNCQHHNRVGDNYGESCADCGKQLSGYGYGGWFGNDVDASAKCIHLFSPVGEEGDKTEICIYCETIRKNEEK